ncbi:uncharacterized protein ARMOST_22281 [Armillaria ostoyae]|uniref:Uncharacterized protein n=1 Tax=Armillaria ostoyae TaxID=47428 RepID=A0A284SCE9_ARMOS|nr:uncharacterized protein ARMOST_22281 [Armillaria ostoyae]
MISNAAFPASITINFLHAVILSSSEPSFSYVRATFCHSRGVLQAGVLDNGRRDIYGRSYLSCRRIADSSGTPASPVQ